MNVLHTNKPRFLNVYFSDVILTRLGIPAIIYHFLKQNFSAIPLFSRFLIVVDIIAKISGKLMKSDMCISSILI